MWSSCSLDNIFFYFVYFLLLRMCCRLMYDNPNYFTCFIFTYFISYFHFALFIPITWNPILSRDPPLDNPCPNSIILNVSHQAAIVWFTEQECMHVAGHTRGQPAPLGEDSRDSSCPSVSQYNGIVLSQKKQRNAISPVGRQDGTGASVNVFAWLDSLGKIFCIRVTRGIWCIYRTTRRHLFLLLLLCVYLFTLQLLEMENFLGWLMVSISVNKNTLYIWSSLIILISTHVGHN